jgi:hypothetical protein
MNRKGRRAQKVRARKLGMNVGDAIVWTHDGKSYPRTIEAVCEKCGAAAVVKLPDVLREQQPDETTHVCLAAIGGCNAGYTNATPSEVTWPVNS